MSTKDITLANFNCTFRVGDSIFPMLQYFSELILPAVRTKDYVRRGKDTEHSLTDVEVVNLTPTSETPNFALVGRHVKRVRLLIKHDYNISSGFIPKDERHWSAPYSTFVLLLKNHRLIHFQDQNGSPALGSLRTTINSSIREFRKKAIKEAYDDIRALGPESRYFELV